MGRLFLLFMLLVISHSANSQYIGTGSVTQGHATTTIPSIYTCTAGRTPAIGTITASDLTVWTVPAAVHFTDVSFPFASDLYNPCNGHTYSNTAAALAVLNGSDIVTVDADGEVITAFIFADNYFELYVNGIPIGKDNVPYTQFNSNIVRFRAKRPFTIAMQLVDWEEHLGLGAELSGAFAYHDGDGGMVAVFKDATGQIIATTGPDWKAQTFYTAPVTDLTCPTESGSSRLSSNCSNADATDGSNFFGLHWSKPANWMEPTFNDLSWPAATTFSNATVGVNNKSAYTNFTDIFDDVSNDAQFIWSTNLILDNEVIVRHTVNSSLMIPETTTKQSVKIFPNPAQDKLVLIMDRELTESFRKLEIFNCLGQLVYRSNNYDDAISLTEIAKGIYIIKISLTCSQYIQKLVIQ